MKRVLVRQIKIRKDGMFAAVNAVVHHVYQAELHGYVINLDGSRSTYRDDTREGDPWNYYFEDCFERDPHASYHPLGKSAQGVPPRQDSLIMPRRLDAEGNMHLYPPTNRSRMSEIIAKYIRLKPAVRRCISEFRERHFGGEIIGVHLRGPGGNSGGAGLLKVQHELVEGVPFELFFRHIDDQLEVRPDARLFLCSDSQFVVDNVSKHYGDRVFTYPATRSPYGELHNLNEGPRMKNEGIEHSRYKLGEDMIAEAYLLAETAHLIHGISSVSNFVLCKNPDLEHTDVYEGQH